MPNDGSPKPPHDARHRRAASYVQEAREHEEKAATISGYGSLRGFSWREDLRQRVRDLPAGDPAQAHIRRADRAYWRAILLYLPEMEAQARVHARRSFLPSTEDILPMIQLGWFRAILRWESDRSLPAYAWKWGLSTWQRSPERQGSVAVPTRSRAGDGAVGYRSLRRKIDHLEDPDLLPAGSDLEDAVLRRIDQDRLVAMVGDVCTDRQRNVIQLRIGDDAPSCADLEPVFDRCAEVIRGEEQEGYARVRAALRMG